MSFKLGVGSSLNHLLSFRKVKKTEQSLKIRKWQLKYILFFVLFFCKDRDATLHKITYGPNGKVMKAKENFESKVLPEVRKIYARFLRFVLYHAR